ncbi:MAG: hypothetical protein FJ293_15450 [Planctomycetes bacterium]|nr:hypothetical protein [Planctomycetota bacterium]
MARSDPPAELATLAAIEADWRDALSFVLAGEAAAASRAIDRAGTALRSLPAADVTRTRLSSAELIEHAASIERLTALHRRLLDASTGELERIDRELAGVPRQRATLSAYAAQVPTHSRCDATG